MGTSKKSSPLNETESTPIDYWGKSTEGLLHHVYEMRRRASYGKSSLAGMGEAFCGSKGISLEYVLVLAAIKRTLGWDYLILTIDVIYDGEDMDPLYDLVGKLSAWARVSPEKAVQAIENYQIFKGEYSRHGKADTVLDGWYKMSMGILEEEFRERGWVDTS